MTSVNLNKIQVIPLKKINSLEGNVMHCMKYNDSGFLKFGEAYFSSINYKKIKAWKMHKKMTLNITVPYGSIKFVFFDGINSFREEIVGDSRYSRLTIPPLIWFGFYGISKPQSILLNITDMFYNKDEI